MRIGELGGEFALIDRIAAAGPRSGDTVVLGIGDDCAALNSSLSDQRTLVTTDTLIEDIHFRRRWIDPYSLGWKSVCVNLSDIAAMGGTPTATFLALALPGEIDVEYVDELYRGINDACDIYGSCVAGGDTNRSPGPLVIGVTQMGTVSHDRILLRSGARPGDRIIVTGTLGAAAAGLYMLEEYGRDAAETAYPEAVQAQLHPLPRIAEAQAAQATSGVTAAMDLSDGLVADLGKLCRASGTGARLDSTLVPIAPVARRIASSQARESGCEVRWALHGGEDYELLLVVAPESAEAVCSAIRTATGTPALVAGEITDSGTVEVAGNGADGAPGWDHFDIG